MIFETTDPRGYKIVCETSTWNNHIVTGHTILEGKESVVEETIKNPDTIYESDENCNRNVYFKKPFLENKPHLYSKVIVELNEYTKTGYVVTAFPCPKMNGGIKEGGVKYVKSKL